MYIFIFLLDLLVFKLSVESCGAWLAIYFCHRLLQSFFHVFLVLNHEFFSRALYHLGHKPHILHLFSFVPVKFCQLLFLVRMINLLDPQPALRNRLLFSEPWLSLDNDLLIVPREWHYRVVMACSVIAQPNGFLMPHRLVKGPHRLIRIGVDLDWPIVDF